MAHRTFYARAIATPRGDFYRITLLRAETRLTALPTHKPDAIGAQRRARLHAVNAARALWLAHRGRMAR